MNRAQTAFEKAYQEQNKNHNRDHAYKQQLSRLNHLMELNDNNPDQLKYEVSQGEIENFKKAHAYTAWKKDQFSRACKAFVIIACVISVLLYVLQNLGPGNSLIFIIPVTILFLAIFALFYLYVLMLWVFNYVSERNDGGIEARKKMSELLFSLSQ